MRKITVETDETESYIAGRQIFLAIKNRITNHSAAAFGLMDELVADGDLKPIAQVAAHFSDISPPQAQSLRREIDRAPPKITSFANYHKYFMDAVKLIQSCNVSYRYRTQKRGHRNNMKNIEDCFMRWHHHGSSVSIIGFPPYLSFDLSNNNITQHPQNQTVLLGIRFAYSDCERFFRDAGFRLSPTHSSDTFGREEEKLSHLISDARSGNLCRHLPERESAWQADLQEKILSLLESDPAESSARRYAKKLLDINFTASITQAAAAVGVKKPC